MKIKAGRKNDFNRMIELIVWIVSYKSQEHKTTKGNFRNQTGDKEDVAVS
uniref:Uncharacterized protein n=1 Tax=Arion vulgaris TaxID=1028688 RepID=A0A0B7BTL1_9EUPU